MHHPSIEGQEMSFRFFLKDNKVSFWKLSGFKPLPLHRYREESRMARFFCCKNTTKTTNGLIFPNILHFLICSAVNPSVSPHAKYSPVCSGEVAPTLQVAHFKPGWQSEVNEGVSVMDISHIRSISHIVSACLYPVGSGLSET